MVFAAEKGGVQLDDADDIWTSKAVSIKTAPCIVTRYCRALTLVLQIRFQPVRRAKGFFWERVALSVIVEPERCRRAKEAIDGQRRFTISPGTFTIGRTWSTFSGNN